MTGERRSSDARSGRKRTGRRAPERPPAPVLPPPPDPFPGITPDARVEAFLRERYEGAPVRVDALSGDAGSRRYYRIHGPDGEGVVSLYPEPFDPDELTFLTMRGLLAGWGIPVPDVLAVDGRRGVILQQDLGDVSLQSALEAATPGARDELYRQALETLVVVQRESVRAPQRAVCFRVAFDFEKLSWEMHFFWKHFLEGYRKCDLSVEDRAALADGFHRLTSEIATWPRVLAHRDYHSRNLMLHAGQLVWIDFQDARMGHATYDLASLLRDSYVDLDEAFVADRVEEFRQRAVPGEGRDLFQRRFELMCLQRNIKALGTFGFQGAVKGSRVYLPYIPRTLANVRRNLVRYPELSALHRALARHLEELA